MPKRRMNEGPTAASHPIGAAIATLLGVTFFFAIIGVFGLSTSIATLVFFVALAVFIFRLPQDQGTRL
jgi:ABC-type branched-subunit amino acid transport system permease subunit